MSKKHSYSPLTIAVGAAFATSLMGSAVASAADNPFGMTELSHGYQVADAKAKEGTCGANKASSQQDKMGKDMDQDEQAGTAMGSGNMEDSHGATGSDSKKTTEGKCGASK